MRIVILTGIYPPKIGGPAVFSQSFARWLEKRGHDVKIITLCSSKSGKVTCVHASPITRRWKEIREALAAVKPDACLATDTISVGYAAATSGVKYAVRFVGDQPWEIARGNNWIRVPHAEYRRKPSLAAAPLRWLQNKTLRKASVVITLNPFLASICREHNNHVVVIPNSVDSTKTPSRAAARKKLGLHGKTLLSVGRLASYKRVHGVIDAMTNLPGYSLLIAGEGSERKRLEKLCKKLGVSDRVRFMGNIANEKLALYYRACDVLVVNSEYEGTSHTILEASVQGIAVAAADNEGNASLLPKKCLFRLGDAKQMLERINHPQKPGKIATISREQQFRKYEEALSL